MNASVFYFELLYEHCIIRDALVCHAAIYQSLFCQNVEENLSKA